MSTLVKRHANHVHEPKKILILASNSTMLKGFPVGFFAEELTHPFFEFIKAGHEVHLASPKGGKVE